MYKLVRLLSHVLCSGKLSEDSIEVGAASGVAPRQFKSKLEEALTAKQESEAKVATLEEKVKQYETEITDLKTRVSQGVFYIIMKTEHNYFLISMIIDIMYSEM